MPENSDEIPEHPDGLPFPSDGIEAREGPSGHQRIEGKAAEFIYAGFDEFVKVVVEVTYHDQGESDRTYRAILRDEEGGIHLAGGGEGVNWIDLDYGWEDVVAAVDDFMEENMSDDDQVTEKVVKGKEEYLRLRASMN